MVIRNKISPVLQKENLEAVVYMVDGTMFGCDQDLKSQKNFVLKPSTRTQHYRATNENKTRQEIILTAVWAKEKAKEKTFGLCMGWLD